SPAVTSCCKKALLYVMYKRLDRCEIRPLQKDVGSSSKRRDFQLRRVTVVHRESEGCLRDISSVFKIESKQLLRKTGAGDEARTRNFQLGKLNFRSFIFNTYKIIWKKCACMHCTAYRACIA